MRHALITAHLLHEASAAATDAAERGPRLDAPPDPVPAAPRRRLATLARRARALVARTT